jgi:uncharacterized protein YfdQ (DUF2303 family)
MTARLARKSGCTERPSWLDNLKRKRLLYATLAQSLLDRNGDRMRRQRAAIAETHRRRAAPTQTIR